MTPHIAAEASMRIDWSAFRFIGSMMPPRDPDEEDEDDEDDEDEEDADEPAVVREPDED
jgi:hypothetical protein